jgi:hypothetical protein
MSRPIVSTARLLGAVARHRHLTDEERAIYRARIIESEPSAEARAELMRTLHTRDDRGARDLWVSLWFWDHGLSGDPRGFCVE